MATQTQTTQTNDDGFGITSTIDSTKIDLRKFRNKWGTKEEFNISQSILKREWQMREHRNISSPWDIPLSAISSDVKGSSKTTSRKLEDYFIYCYKLWSMWSRYIQGKSNLKSPITFASVETAMAEYMESYFGFSLSTLNEGQWGKVRLMEHILKYERNKGNFEKAEATSIKECMITGTSIEQHIYLKKEREIEAVLTGVEAMQRIEQEQVKNPTFDLGQFTTESKPMTSKITVTDWDGLAKINVSVFDFLVDPSATELQGAEKDATDCIRLMRPSREMIIEELSNSKDPFIIKANIDKIKSARESYEDYNNQWGIYKLGPEFTNYDTTDTKAYYNKRTGKYILQVNDVVVRNGPLPYRHGQLPFTKHIWTEWPNKFYGVGMAIVLANTQVADEVLRNMEIEKEKKRLAINMLVGASDSETVKRDYDPYSSFNIIGVENPGAVKELGTIQTNAGSQALRSENGENAVMISGVNPLASALPSPNQPVRNNVMAMQSTLKILKKGFRSYGNGEKEGIKQYIEIVKQIYPELKIEKITGMDEDGTPIYSTQYKKISIDGYKMGTDSQTGELTEEEAKGANGFEVKPEHLNDLGDIDILIDYDRLIPPGHQQRIEDIQSFMTVFAPLLTNPQVADMPGVSELIRWGAEEYGIPSNVTDKLRDPGGEADVKNAEEQNAQMQQGIEVPGYAGASTIHKYYHLIEMMDLIMKIQSVSGNTTLNQVSDIEKSKKILGIFAKHLEQDDVPKIAAEKDILAQANQLLSPQGMMMPPMLAQAQAGQPPEQMPGVSPEGMANISNTPML